MLLLLGSFTFLSIPTFAQNISDQPVSKGVENIILVSDAKIYTVQTTENDTRLVITTAENVDNKEKIAVRKSSKTTVEEKIVEIKQPKIAKSSKDYNTFYTEQNSDSGKYISQSLRNHVSVNFKNFHYKILKNYEIQSLFKQIASQLFVVTKLSHKNLGISPFPVRGPPYTFA